MTEKPADSVGLYSFSLLNDKYKQERIDELVNAVANLKMALAAFGNTPPLAVEVSPMLCDWLKRECIVGQSRICISGNPYKDGDQWHPEVLGVPFKPGVPKR